MPMTPKMGRNTLMMISISAVWIEIFLPNIAFLASSESLRPHFRSEIGSFRR